MKRKEYYTLFAILILGFLVRVLYLPGLQNVTFFNIDEVRYFNTAVQFLQKGILGFNSTEPNSYITPGYILFLAGIFKLTLLFTGSKTYFMLAAVSAQVIFSVGVVCLVYLISWRTIGWKTAVVAALLASLYPPFIFATAKIMTETIFTFFFLLYIYLVQLYIEEKKPLLHGLTGIVLALTTLIRPTVAPIIIIPYLLQWVNRKKPVYWQGLVVAFLCFVVVMSPWWLRNYRIYHKFVPFSTESGDPFLRGTDPYDPIGNHGERLIKDVPEDKKMQLGLKRIKEGLKKEPLYWIKWFTVGKATLLWSRPWGYVPEWGSFIISKRIHIIFVLILGWPGLILGLKKPQLRWLAFQPVFFTLLQLLFLAIPRYMFQLTPIMLIFAAYAIVQLGGFTKKLLKYNIS